MRKIGHILTPPELEASNRDGRTWADWDRTVRDSIRTTLRRSQMGVCAYCERSIDGTRNEDLVVEHFHPRTGNQSEPIRNQDDWDKSSCRKQSGASTHLKSTTEWSNLLVSCPGTGPRGPNGKPQTTCDLHKEATDICEAFLNPRRSHLDQLVDIDRGGRAAPAVGMPAGARRIVDQVLNLNAQFLVDARRERIAIEVKRYNMEKSKRKGLTSKQKLTVAARLKERAHRSGTEYPSALLSYAREIQSRA